ncbi:MAG: sensor domain-containing diguanylate cyclase [Bacteroidetes bacterium]|nr:sensor domain-containing diguanylate cyclase [Bacteroidota bacterium]
MINEEQKDFRYKNQVPSLLGLVELSLKFQGLKKDPQEYCMEAIRYINRFFPEITDVAIYMPDAKTGTLELSIDRITNRKLASTELFRLGDGHSWEVYLSGFSRLIPNLAEDPYFLSKENLPGNNGSYFCFPIEQSNLKRVGTISVYSPDPFFFDEHNCIVLGKVSTLLGMALEMFYSIKEAVERSFRDELTGAYNRRFFNEHYEHEYYRHKRYKTPYGILMLDIDFFKKLNDTFGHAIGDLVLKKVSDSIHVNIRKSDTFARWGGEEFIIFLPDTNDQNALLVAEKIRKGIEDLYITHKTELDFLRAPITVSIGVAAFPSDCEDKTEMITFADSNLYKAKHQGRNRVAAG